MRSSISGRCIARSRGRGHEMWAFYERGLAGAGAVVVASAVEGVVVGGVGVAGAEPDGTVVGGGDSYRNDRPGLVP